ncbi:MAG: hypothetical protein KIT58_21635 [Planctomycetota bacterium]|nr:hypothetical protein [Planctomycetota bacterium]
MKRCRLTFLRRVGKHPHAHGRASSAKGGCPDIWELDTGDFAVIGIDMTSDLLPHLPDDVGCGPDERIVLVDRHVLVEARGDIPNM